MSLYLEGHVGGVEESEQGHEYVLEYAKDCQQEYDSNTDENDVGGFEVEFFAGGFEGSEVVHIFIDIFGDGGEDGSQLIIRAHGK